MKKIFGLLSCYIIFGIGCTKTALNDPNNDEILPTLSKIAHRSCATQEVLEAQLKDDPTLAKKWKLLRNLQQGLQKIPPLSGYLAMG